MEADLAFRGLDLRDYWLPGGGPTRLSLRRLLVLVRGLSPDSVTAAAFRRAEKTRHTDRLRGRLDHYAALRAHQEARTS